MTKIRFKRGAHSSALSLTAEDGEPIWTTNTGRGASRLYVGDGSASPGVQVGWPFAPNPGWHSGWYYTNTMTTISYVAATGAANIALYLPIFVGGGCNDAPGGSIQSVHAEVVAAQAGTNFAIAIYSNSKGWPDERLYQSGNISAASTGVKTWSLSASLIGEWYWLAFNCNSSTATYRATDNLVTTGGVLGSHNVGGTTVPMVYYELAAFGGTPFPAKASPIGSSNGDTPMVWVRAA